MSADNGTGGKYGQDILGADPLRALRHHTHEPTAQRAAGIFPRRVPTRHARERRIALDITPSRNQ